MKHQNKFALTLNFCREKKVDGIKAIESLAAYRPNDLTPELHTIVVAIVQEVCSSVVRIKVYY
jgi:hypothetical protein